MQSQVKKVIKLCGATLLDSRGRLSPCVAVSGTSLDNWWDGRSFLGRFARRDIEFSVAKWEILLDLELMKSVTAQMMTGGKVSYAYTSMSRPLQPAGAAA